MISKILYLIINEIKDFAFNGILLKLVYYIKDLSLILYFKLKLNFQKKIMIHNFVMFHRENLFIYIIIGSLVKHTHGWLDRGMNAMVVVMEIKPVKYK